MEEDEGRESLEVHDWASLCNTLATDAARSPDETELLAALLLVSNRLRKLVRAVHRMRDGWGPK